MKNVLPLLAFLFPVLSFGQTGALETQIQEVANYLFQAMEKGDSIAARALFHPDAKMRTTYIQKNTGKTQLFEGSVNEFISAIGEPRIDTWEERTANYSIRVDGILAHIWMDYSFYLNGKFSHCGVNSFHLILVDGAWKIMDVIDTRRATNCSDL